MDRRKFILWSGGVVGICAVPTALNYESNRCDETISEGCDICGGKAIFDAFLDVNVCVDCGAHETARGWEKR
jgi:hypothetical protein